VCCYKISKGRRTGRRVQGVQFSPVSSLSLYAHTDLSDDYLQALKRLVDGLEAGGHELRTVMGANEYTDYLKRRRLQVDAIERGLLEREMYLARAI
jgi:hypothetical protein